MSKNITVQHKRSNSSGNIPTTALIQIGELAINFADKSLYTQDTFGNIIELARDIIIDSAQPGSPAQGDIWFNSSTNDIKYYDSNGKWVNITYSGNDVASATFNGTPTGTGTLADPYVYSLTPTEGESSLVDTFTISGLQPYQVVPIVDLNAASNGSRFIATNNVADGSGVLAFSIIFNDQPLTPGGSVVRTAKFKVGVGSVYVNIDCATVSAVIPFPQTINIPTNLIPAGTTWTAANDTLTSSGDILLTVDGVNYSYGPISVTTGSGIGTCWKASPYDSTSVQKWGSGVGIDSPHGTTITGTIASSNGGVQNCSLTIDKQPDAITFTPITDCALSSTAVTGFVTISGTNSYSYVTSNDSVKLAISGGTYNTVPASGTSIVLTDSHKIRLQLNTASTVSTATSATINISGTTATASATTGANNSIVKPTILTPMDGVTGSSTSFTITSSAYTTIGAVGTHASTDWEISTDSAFSTLVATNYSSTTNKTLWNPTGLVSSTKYWIRVRYRSTDPIVSSWSAPVTITTA